MSPRRSRSPWLALALLMLTAALVAVAVVAVVRTHGLRSVAAADNEALVDTAATRDVSDDVSDGLTRILTFDHTDPDTTREAADEVLAGDARKEYDELFAALLDQTASQQLTLTTQVTDVGVKVLTDDSAELLVFLDQSSTRATDGEANVAAAQIAVTARRDGDRWQITGLDPL